jgi:hypothetical protein
MFIGMSVRALLVSELHSVIKKKPWLGLPKSIKMKEQEKRTGRPISLAS